MGSLTLAMAILILLGSGGMASGQANAPPVAVTVARTTEETSFAQPLAMPHVVVDVGNAWNRSANYLSVSYNSTFFFHINAGAKANQAVNMNLRGYYHADIFRSSTTHNGIDTTGRDIISPVVAGVQIYVENDLDSHLYSDSGIQTSMTAFDLSYFLSDTDKDMFCVYNQNRVIISGIVPFQYKIIDTRDSWNSEIVNEFYIRTSGYYFLSFSAGVDGFTEMRAQIRSTDIGLLSELWRSSDNHNGQDVISKAIMVELLAGDSVYITLLAGSLYSDAERQTSFCGFRYDLGLEDEIAWSVYTTTSTTTGSEPLNPLPLNGQLLNINGIFSNVDNMVTITQSGLYYIQLTVAAQPNWPVDVYIMRDRAYVEANVWKTSTSHNGLDTASTGLLLELSQGNDLSLVLGPNSGLYSDMERQVTFTGFLLEPYPDPLTVSSKLN